MSVYFKTSEKKTAILDLQQSARRPCWRISLSFIEIGTNMAAIVLCLILKGLVRVRIDADTISKEVFLNS